MVLKARFRFSRRGVIAATMCMVMAFAAPVGAKADVNDAQAKQFVKMLADQAIGVLSQADSSMEKRLSVFRDLLNERFNMPFLAGIALGRYGPRKGRDGIPGKTPTSDQFAEYKGLFNEFVLQKYSMMLGAYSGQTVEVGSPTPRGRRDFLVPTWVVSRDGSSVEVSWHVRDYDGILKVIDIRVANISMVVAQREEFASVIRREGFEGLLRLLRQKAELVSNTG